MNERLTDENPSPEVAIDILSAIAAAREEAQARREAYQESIAKMNELCEQLKGSKIRISGLLYARDSNSVYGSDPASHVEDLLVSVGSARVDTQENHAQPVAQEVPFVDIAAWVVGRHELVCARLDVGEYGVTAEVAASEPAR